MIKSKDSSISSRVKRSQQDELRVAKALGGKRLLQSGAMKSSIDGRTAGADLVAGLFWVEQKSTVKPSISIKRTWLDKVSIGAASQGRWPALSISFQTLKQDWIGTPTKIFDCFAPMYFYSTGPETTQAGSFLLRGEELVSRLKGYPSSPPDDMFLPLIEIQFRDSSQRVTHAWQFVPLVEFIKVMEDRRV